MSILTQTLLVKPEMFVYQIPPRQSNRGYRGSDWNLANPDYTVRLRIIGEGNKCLIKMEDKISGEPFAECPVEQFPGPAVEPVTDSSRYFVLRVQDGSGTGRHAYLGVGFGDRADSFDFNVALQDFFKRERIEKEVASTPAPQLNLALKEGQKIHVNIAGGAAKSASDKPRPSGGGAIGILPPPPGGAGGNRTVQAPPAAAATSGAGGGFDDNAWGSFAGAGTTAAKGSDPFASNPGQSGSGASGGGSGWVQF